MECMWNLFSPSLLSFASCRAQGFTLIDLLIGWLIDWLIDWLIICYAQEDGVNQTSGIDMAVTQERVILLDTQVQSFTTCLVNLVRLPTVLEKWVCYSKYFHPRLSPLNGHICLSFTLSYMKKALIGIFWKSGLNPGSCNLLGRIFWSFNLGGGVWGV